MKTKVYGYALTSIYVEKDHAQRPTATNAVITVSYLKNTMSNGLAVIYDDIRLNIYAVARYYPSTRTIKPLIAGLIDMNLDDHEFVTDGYYTTKKFDKQLEQIEREIKRGLYT